MKKKFCLLFILIFSSFVIAETHIKKDSSFTVMGICELRESCGFDKPLLYRTLAHESGMKVKVLEVGKTETLNEKTGTWLYVITTSPMWVDTGEWIERYKKYWIFYTSSMLVFDFKE